MFYWTYYIHFSNTVTLFNSCFYVLLDILHSLYQHCNTVQFMFLCFTGHITFTLPALLHCSIHGFMFYWTYYIHFTSTVTLFNSWFFLCFTGHITFTLPALLHCSIHVFMFYWTYYIHFTSTVTLFNSYFFMFYWTYCIHFIKNVILFNSSFYFCTFYR